MLAINTSYMMTLGTFWKPAIRNEQAAEAPKRAQTQSQYGDRHHVACAPLG